MDQLRQNDIQVCLPQQGTASRYRMSQGDQIQNVFNRKNDELFTDIRS